MLHTKATAPLPTMFNRSRKQTAPKDYLLDHLECALLLARQRGLELTTYLITLSIGSLYDTVDNASG